MDSFALKVIGFSRVFYEGEALQVQVPLQEHEVYSLPVIQLALSASEYQP